MNYEVLYTVKFKTTINIPDDTPESQREQALEEAIANIQIPENRNNRYKDESFDVVTCQSDLQQDLEAGRCPNCFAKISDSTMYGDTCPCGHTFTKKED